MMNETFYPPRPARSQGLKGINFVTLAGLTLAVLALASSMLSALNMRYEVTPEALRIRSGFSTREIPLDEVTGVWRPEALTGGVRKFGTAVPNLRTGRWRFNETGDITLYATRLETLVVVDTADGRYGVTPENPDAFMDAVQVAGARRLLPRGRHGNGRGLHAHSASPGRCGRSDDAVRRWACRAASRRRCGTSWGQTG